MKIAIAIRAGRHTYQRGGDLVGPQSREREALLAAHAPPGRYDRLTIPVGPVQHVVQCARVAQVHIQEVRLFPIGVTDSLIIPRDISRRVRRQLIVRIDIDHQPALGGPLCVGPGVQGLHTRILQLNESGELTFLRGLGHIAVRLRSERVEDEHVHLEANTAVM